MQPTYDQGVAKRHRAEQLDPLLAQASSSMYRSNSFGELRYDDTPQDPPARLSRHIPDRGAMDMAMSSFALNSESFSSQTLDRLLPNDRRVLTFGHERSVNAAPATTRIKAKGGATRVLHTNPFRVLDAPALPTVPSQVLDWGVNNEIVIGLSSALFCWDADTGNASKVTEFDRTTIRCVQWMVHEPHTQCAIATTDGTAWFFDLRAQQFVRSVRASPGISAMSSSGPITAVASSGPRGDIFIYDTRMSNAAVTRYEAHAGATTAVKFNTQEPFYLASGGDDGAVRVWDARNTQRSAARYSFNGLHQGSVGALAWYADKRSVIFSGGAQDGRLLCINTHEMPANCVFASADTGSSITSIANSPRTSEVLTSQGPGGGELQLRRVDASLGLVGNFSAQNSTEGFSCMSLAPDRKTVCAAQLDESLKFFNVFEPPKRKDVGRAASVLEEALR